MTYEEIIALYLGRDEAAIRNTADKYGQRLFNLANHIVYDRGAAEECENDTYFRAWQAIPPAEPRKHFFAFLARITRNLALDRYRAASAQKRSAEVASLTTELEQCLEGHDNTEEAVDSMLLGRTIGKFLRQIPEERRNIFLRRYWYFDSIGEIAERYCISESKVKSALFRTRNELREQLRKEGYAL